MTVELVCCAIPRGLTSGASYRVVQCKSILLPTVDSPVEAPNMSALRFIAGEVLNPVTIQAAQDSATRKHNPISGDCQPRSRSYFLSVLQS